MNEGIDGRVVECRVVECRAREPPPPLPLSAVCAGEELWPELPVVAPEAGTEVAAGAARRELRPRDHQVGHQVRELQHSESQ